jgi:hypothetical protein
MLMKFLKRPALPFCRTAVDRADAEASGIVLRLDSEYGRFRRCHHPGHRLCSGVREQPARKRREGVAEMYDPRFPPAGYRLDRSDPDVLVLRRGDGTFVAAFSALGATRKAVQRAAEDDWRTHANRRNA